MTELKWTRVKSVKEFLAIKGVRNVGVHAMKDRVLHWPVCARCGLLALKNDPTRQALRKPCITWEDE